MKQKCGLAKSQGLLSILQGLVKTILQGMQKGKRGNKQKKRWEDSIKEWIWMDLLLQLMQDQVKRDSSKVIHSSPMALQDYGLN